MDNPDHQAPHSNKASASLDVPASSNLSGRSAMLIIVAVVLLVVIAFSILLWNVVNPGPSMPSPVLPAK